MFENLNDEIRKIETHATLTERLLRYTGILGAAALVFGALYTVILFLE